VTTEREPYGRPLRDQATRMVEAAMRLEKTICAKAPTGDKFKLHVYGVEGKHCARCGQARSEVPPHGPAGIVWGGGVCPGAPVGMRQKAHIFVKGARACARCSAPRPEGV
jgi:hypothetical protein